MIKAKNHVDSLADKMQQSEGKNLTEINLIKDSFTNLIQVLRITFVFDVPPNDAEPQLIPSSEYETALAELLMRYNVPK